MAVRTSRLSIWCGLTSLSESEEEPFQAAGTRQFIKDLSPLCYPAAPRDRCVMCFLFMETEKKGGEGGQTKWAPQIIIPIASWPAPLQAREPAQQRHPTSQQLQVRFQPGPATCTISCPCIQRQIWVLLPLVNRKMKWLYFSYDSRYQQPIELNCRYN